MNALWWVSSEHKAKPFLLIPLTTGERSVVACQIAVACHMDHSSAACSFGMRALTAGQQGRWTYSWAAYEGSEGCRGGQLGEEDEPEAPREIRLGCRPRRSRCREWALERSGRPG